MPGEPSYLVDTNILLRLCKADDPQRGLVQAALDRLFSAGAALCYTTQNLAEFWNVCTRPAGRNGLGLSIAETDRRARAIESMMALLPDGESVHREWRRLVVAYEVRGVQVHDARLAAAMLVHGVTRVLTLDESDFMRFTGITALHPRTLT
jgi:predicted nucleic acid-binding protein